VCSCCWASPAESSSGVSPAAHMVIFYCLNFETRPTSRVRFLYLFPLGIGWPSYIPGTGFTFLSTVTTRRATVDVS
jgi:hypothetical protein